MIDHIHILGASGSGTTTLGAALARSLGYAHFDTDDFYWERTDPPFQKSRPVPARIEKLAAALDAQPRWVLSGSLCSWGDPFVPMFDLVIFLYVPPRIRMARLLERERRLYGAEAIAPGGAMHEIYTNFIAWAGAYDEGGEDMRSLQTHERWLEQLRCPVLRLDGTSPLEELVAHVENTIRRLHNERRADTLPHSPR